ncbi:hypothetical protein TNCT_428741 [Trichonephila clavata]|uniref:Uncharacterized protein n=1 Tax=Trichonephila clavata TaxID=2740835 RepID=A0A8X6G5M0_TRICU|nr:hypothetical protein TNCT_428741 [Trichonephila clavata]
MHLLQRISRTVSRVCYVFSKVNALRSPYDRTDVGATTDWSDDKNDATVDIVFETSHHRHHHRDEMACRWNSFLSHECSSKRFTAVSACKARSQRRNKFEILLVFAVAFLQD